VRTIVALALAFVASSALSFATSAAVITVDTLANGPGDCSLPKPSPNRGSRVSKGLAPVRKFLGARDGRTTESNRGWQR
jgi:hypothetical protein